MAQMRLYNTMTRKVEDFAPADGRVARIYSCGPTVYDPAHLGNFRTFLFGDLLRRALRLAGYEVQQVMNITDVDDTIIKRAGERGVTIAEVASPGAEIVQQDRKFLRSQDAENYPRATDHVAETVALVESLTQRGLAYQAEDGSVYFAIGKFEGYGKLSRLDTREIRTGARVAQDDRKSTRLNSSHLVISYAVFCL